ncbi:MurR/RpiR family transcriptional regulator [Paenibacillus sp.]|uniref:MurR/RpiR family transcriptional regulator n=1 Tax=Paenibacillus sp. TaxID=58172 RepID=UPI002D397D96|nr:MurR/RpiR family transcriptional regulator [Paenibacillus sp.]HZG54984.1 MurR/RpiR family transcriptional regulator [Paenibacillus sp.]
MSSIVHSLRERASSFHPKERTLAAYIVEHPLEATRLSITELADRSGTSAATITRFCRALRFDGFAEFKLKLAEELAAPAEGQPTYQDIVAGNSLERIVGAMEANHLRSIADTTRLLDVGTLQRAIDALHAARRIDLYGVATSGIVAQDAYQKLIRIGKEANAFSDPHLQITSASNLGPGDVAIGISYSGETIETVDALRCAKTQGATTISLTKYGVNALSSAADIALFASSLEEGMRRGDMASRIAQLHVVDILFTGLVSSRFDAYVPRLERTYWNVKQYRNGKGR